ncbi:MAG: FmdB family zinc ribbon protein [Terracidiphilus sp.]
MPLYAYRCTQCGHHFEKIQSFSSKQLFVCPQCGGVLERPLTAPAFNFKGSGWYVNDYAGKSPTPASESAPSETKAPETKASATPASSPATPTASPATATS